MGVSAGTAYIDIVPNLDKFQSALGNAGSKMANAGKKLSTRLTLPIIAAGTAAFNAFADAEKISAQTEAVIKSTGGASGVSAKQVDRLASSISEMSGIDDEAIKEGQNLLLTFTNLRNEAGKGNDIFDQTTRTMVDLATAMGTDPKGAAIQLGKALNDPVKGITALTRVGVSFTEGQKKQIESLVKSGKTMKAQKIILKELNKEFGGSAKAFGGTAAGRIAKLRVAIGNLGESFGEALLPFVEKASEALSKLVTWFKNLSPETRAMIVKIGLLVAAIGPVLIVMGKLFTAFSQVSKGLSALGKLASANPWILIVAATVALAILIIKNWDKIKAFVLSIWNAIKDAALVVWGGIKRFIIAPIIAAKDFLVGLWNGIKRTAINAWNGLKEKATEIWNGIKDAIMAPLNAIQEAIIETFNLGPTQADLDALSAREAAAQPAFEAARNRARGGKPRGLARGGIALRPMTARIAENAPMDPEVVAPLSNLREMLGIRSGGGMRLIQGKLELVNGQAYISGIAEDVDEEDRRFDDGLQRMNR